MSTQPGPQKILESQTRRRKEDSLIYKSTHRIKFHERTRLTGEVGKDPPLTTHRPAKP